MAQIKDKIKNSFDEALILITAAEVVAGFEFKAVFEPGFEALPPSSQLLKISGLGLLLLCLNILMAPAAYHHIVTRGEDSEDLYRFTTSALALALVPFALALTIDMYVMTAKVLGAAAGVGAAGASLACALGCWYAFAFFDKRRGVDLKERSAMKTERKTESTADSQKLKDKIDQVLQEARMVIPGAQALLGFQFVVVLTDAFDKLPADLKYIHLASLGLIAVCVILLMTPAVYHRIVEEGEETEHFYALAARLVIAAMVPLALGMAGDFYVVVAKVVQSQVVAIGVALAALSLFYGVWFGFTGLRRSQKSRRALSEPSVPGHHEQSILSQESRR